MRPGQQHNRRNNRGRHQNGGGGGHSHGGGQRKGQNPLTRSYESNGPDVKVRGTPMHIAEKYMSLARDATSAGDPVLAENYLQHAEHYNRIIMAYREQQEAGGPTQQPQRFRQPGFDPNDPGDDVDDGQPDTTASDDGNGQQPLGGADQPAASDRPTEMRGDRPERQERFERPDRGDRPFNDRGDRPFNDRGSDRGDRQFNRFDGDRNRDNRERNFDGQPGDNRSADNRHDRQFRRDRFDRNNRHQGGDRYQGDRNRDRSNEAGGQQTGGPPRPPLEARPIDQGEPRADRPERLDRPERNDRGFRQHGYDRGDRGDRFDRGGERPDRQDRPDRQQDRSDRPEAIANGQPPHERHVPERRQPTPPAEQPAPEWVAQERAPVAVPAPEPVVVRSADPVQAAPAAEPRPARAAPRKRAAPAAPATGVAFQEHDQPSFLKRSTRKPKPEAKPSDGESKPE